MKVLMTVSNDSGVIRESLMDIENVVVSATLEVMQGNVVAMVATSELNPQKVNFDMRESRTIQ